MKDLDRSQVYDLRGITLERSQELYVWLRANDEGWDYDPEEFHEACLRNEALGFDHGSSEWIFPKEVEAETEIQSIFNQFDTLSFIGDTGVMANFDFREFLYKPKDSLHLVAEKQDWNAYQFDIVKKIDQASKNGRFKEDLREAKELIDLWLNEKK